MSKFSGARSKTVHFPQYELFGSQKSKFFQNFFTSKSRCTATMAAQGLGAETLRKYSFQKEEQCVEIFRRLAWKLWISHEMNFLKVNNQNFSNLFASRIGYTATLAAQGLGGWNFEEIQFLNRRVMCWNFYEASLKTVDFPPDSNKGLMCRNFQEPFF